MLFDAFKDVAIVISVWSNVDRKCHDWCQYYIHVIIEKNNIQRYLMDENRDQ